MQSRTQHDPHSAAPDSDDHLAGDSELGILWAVVRMLATGVPVLAEPGRFLLVNYAAIAQLGIAVGETASRFSQALQHRRETGLEVLRSGRAAVAEESVSSGQAKQIFLPAHRPVRIADPNLLLSSSTA